MPKIDGVTKSIQELFSGKRYELDSYQREYRWQQRNVEELLEDFQKAFLDSYKPGDQQISVLKYKSYFLGTVVISEEGGHSSIIDGQQRLTSLTLLLIYLNNLQKQRPDKVDQLDLLIYSNHFGTKSFNIDVDERRELLDCLFQEKSYVGGSKSESVNNMYSRYKDIERGFPTDLKDTCLPIFIQWLITNVNLVVITAPTPEDAYAIFESMNDRGMSLTPTEMLKGFLVSNLFDLDEATQKSANDLWRTRIQALKEQEKEGDADFVRSWLRAQYAVSRKDFEDIGSWFHKWLREHLGTIKLTTSQDFKSFLLKNFDVYSQVYIKVLKASQQWTPELPEVYFNAYNSITLQPAMMLAPINLTDDDQVIERKLHIIGIYLDIFVARRIVNFKAISRRVIEDKFYAIIPKIRGLDENTLVQFLKTDLANQLEQFSALTSYSLHQQNGPQVHYVLARLTDFIEHECGGKGKFTEYINRVKATDPYEIEHLWAKNQYPAYASSFQTEQEFLNYRNRIGGLVLLPKSKNASLNDKLYSYKVNIYPGENPLVRSLTPVFYQNNTKLQAFQNKYQLNFHAYPSAFTRSDLDARQVLYLQLCEAAWSLSRLDDALS